MESARYRSRHASEGWIVEMGTSDDGDGYFERHSGLAQRRRLARRRERRFESRARWWPPGRRSSMWVDNRRVRGRLVSPEEESARVIPVIKRFGKGVGAIETTRVHFGGYVLRKRRERAADAGVDIINDVSGGSWDPAMLPTVADMKKPLPSSGMREKRSSNMQNASNTTYEGHVCDEVGDGLFERRVDAFNTASNRGDWIDRESVSLRRVERTPRDAREIYPGGTKPFSAVGRRCDERAHASRCVAEAFLGRAFWKVERRVSATQPLFRLVALFLPALTYRGA